jgi:large subunit ribosomal protein L30
MPKKLKLTQVRSIIGSQRKKHRSVMKALGFHRNYRTLYKNDTPQIRGMLEKVRHLVECEEINEKNIPPAPERSTGFTVVTGAKGKKKAAAEGEEPGDAAADQH